MKRLALVLSFLLAASLPALAQHRDRGEHRGYYRHEYRAPIRHYGNGHFYRGEWHPFGVGPCWQWTPFGYIWGCGAFEY